MRFRSVVRLPLPRHVAARLCALRRRPLHWLHPPDRPLIVHIRPCSVWIPRCGFCPTRRLDHLKEARRPARTAEHEQLRKIIGHLSGLLSTKGRKLNLLHPQEDGGPLLNADLCDIVRYAAWWAVSHQVATTNAALAGSAACASERRSRCVLNDSVCWCPQE